MKVMHINRTLNIGGIEKLLTNLAEHTDRKQAELMFLLLENRDFDLDEQIRKHGCKIIKRKRLGRYNKIGLIYQCYKVFKKIQPDVVHSHMCYDSAFIMFAAKIAGVKIRIVHAHSAGFNKSNPLWKIYNSLRRKVMTSSATNLIACSKKAGDALFGEKANYEIIPNGIDLDRFSFDTVNREEVRNTFGIKPNEVVIGHIGRLDVPKNHAFLLEIFQKILDDNTKEYRLMLVGDGPLKKELKAKAQKLGIDKRVIFAGNCNGTEKIYSAFDKIIFPSIFEGLPVSLVEAQTNGLPILASDAIAPETKLTDNLRFYSLDKTAKDWAEESKTMHRKAPGLSKLREYSIDNMIKRLQQIYEGASK